MLHPLWEHLLELRASPCSPALPHPHPIPRRQQWARQPHPHGARWLEWHPCAGNSPLSPAEPREGAVLTCPGSEGGGDGGLLRVAGLQRHHVLGVGAQVAQHG